MNMDELWIVVALCALPFLAFGAAELVMLRRRRRADAIARRRKAPVGELSRRP
jgi:hypothetical protein